METLVKWLYKWRLKMNVSKCCYVIFSKSGRRSNKLRGVESIRLKLNINGENIPYNQNPKFLGVTLNLLTLISTSKTIDAELLNEQPS